MSASDKPTRTAGQPLSQRHLITLATMLIGLVAASFWHLSREPSEGQDLHDSQASAVIVSGRALGTSYALTVAPQKREAADPQAIAETVRNLAETVLNRIDGLMSTYRDDSELQRFNSSRSTASFALSPDTRAVIDVAVEASRLTRGAFDITVAPLVSAWGFGAGGHSVSAAPSAETLEALSDHVGMQTLTLTSEGLRKGHPAVTLDLSGVAKGYAVDEIGRALVQAGYQSWLVEVGGEMRAKGRHPAGRPFTIGVEKPTFDGRQVMRRLPLVDVAVATSGDYRDYREVDGVRKTHIIDPRTREPVAHGLASATVIAKNCAEADALATAMMVLGAEESLALADATDLAVYLIVREADAPGGGFGVRQSRAFERYLTDNSAVPVHDGP